MSDLDQQLLPKLKRIYCEDILKHAYNYFEENEQNITLDSLQQSLRIPLSDLKSTVDLLENIGFIKTVTDGIQLLDKGKDIAVQIVRAHRLWETYLNWETGFTIVDVHKQAERKEHELSQAQIDALDAHLGYPRSDPHGDPIPDKNGYYRKGHHLVLAHLKTGQKAKIAHIEDEPIDVFKKLMSYGFQPDDYLEIQSITEDKIVVIYQLQDISLTAFEAKQIQVIPVSEAEYKPRKSLAELARGASARIASISNQIQGLPRRRLLDLGITPGVKITNFLPSSFGGDPTMYIVRGTKIALRKDQTSLIFIES